MPIAQAGFEPKMPCAIRQTLSMARSVFYLLLNPKISSGPQIHVCKRKKIRTYRRT